MDLSSGTRFGFGYTVQRWAFGQCVRESISNAGMRDRGIVQLSGMLGEKRKNCKISRKELEAGGGKVTLFLLVSQECSWGRETHME